MEKQKKKFKIPLKLAILILVIIAIILIISMNLTTSIKNTSIENFEGDFDGDGKIEKLTIKTTSWEVYVPKNIADDTGDRSETTVFLDNKKIEHEYIYGYIEIIDVDNDGIDEIKTTYNIMPPGHPGTYCQIYKLNNNKLKKIDSYRVFHFTYHKKQIEELTFYDGIGLQPANGYNPVRDENFLEKYIEIQVRNNNCRILCDNQIIYEYETVSDINTTIINEDLDEDKNMELLVDNIILKYEDDEIKIYNDEEFFKSTTDNIVLNIFETNCDFDGDGITDNVKIKQLINNKESNASYTNYKFLFTDLYMNNIKTHKNIVSNNYILSIEDDLIHRHVIIINLKDRYNGKISKKGLRLDHGSLWTIEEERLNSWYNN